MRILIVSATEKEINLILQNADEIKKTGSYLFSGNYNNLQVDFLIAGIGLPISIFRLTRQLCGCSYDLVLNLGIAGSFKENYPIGSVVNVTSEQFGDLGVDDRGEFKTLFDMGFMDKNSQPFTGGAILNLFNSNKLLSIAQLHKVKGITVNKASGKETDIAKKWIKFQPDIESMEGAGIFYVCQSLNTPYIEIRAISNFVEPRDTRKWNIPLALKALTEVTSKLLIELATKP